MDHLKFLDTRSIYILVEVYYEVARLLISLTVQQIGTTVPWYSNKTPLLIIELYEALDYVTLSSGVSIYNNTASLSLNANTKNTKNEIFIHPRLRYTTVPPPHYTWSLDTYKLSFNIGHLEP